MQATCDTHLFGSRGGYRTVAGSSGVSPRERAELEIFGFGQLSDRRGQQMLLERASAFGRRLSSGRFAVTRILPGPDDDGGRPTLELRTVLLDRASYGAIASSGISLLIDTGAVWSATAFAEGRSMSLAVGPRRAIETREIHRRLADAWLSTRTSPQQMVRADEADGARILELAALLDPSDLDEFRWGVGVLSTAVPVDLFTLAPIGSGSGRRPVRDLPKSGPWVHANVANLPERGPWPPLRGVVSRQSTGPVGLAERTPEEWTYDGPQPIARRRGPDRRVVLAGAAILVLGVGAIIAMLLFKGPASPSRPQEFARLPASPETDRGRAGDGKAPDSDGTAAADESQGREEKTPVPGKGMGFPTNPPSGGTAGGSGSSATGQGGSTGAGEQSANPPPPKAPTGDSSSKPEPEAPTGATPPGRPPGESTASKPAETDSTSGVTPAGGGNPPPSDDATGSNGGSAFQTGSSDAGEQVGDEDWCDCKRWLQDPELDFPRDRGDRDRGQAQPVSQELRSITDAITSLESGIDAMKQVPDLSSAEDPVIRKAKSQFEYAIGHLQDGYNKTSAILQDKEQKTAQWILVGLVKSIEQLQVQPDIVRDAQIGLITSDRTTTINFIDPAVRTARERLNNAIDIEDWMSAMKITSPPDLFSYEQGSANERDWRDEMIGYLCRLHRFVEVWADQPTRLADRVDSRKDWSEYVISMMGRSERTPVTQRLFREIDASIRNAALAGVVDKRRIVSQMQDGVLEWAQKATRSAGKETIDCINDLVLSLFPKSR